MLARLSPSVPLYLLSMQPTQRNHLEDVHRRLSVTVSHFAEKWSYPDTPIFIPKVGMLSRWHRAYETLSSMLGEHACGRWFVPVLLR